MTCAQGHLFLLPFLPLVAACSRDCDSGPGGFSFASVDGGLVLPELEPEEAPRLDVTIRDAVDMTVGQIDVALEPDQGSWHIPGWDAGDGTRTLISGDGGRPLCDFDATVMWSLQLPEEHADLQAEFEDIIMTSSTNLGQIDHVLLWRDWKVAYDWEGWIE
jgi:hypothetical protein